jgi:hypothetical protein
VLNGRNVVAECTSRLANIQPGKVVRRDAITISRNKILPVDFAFCLSEHDAAHLCDITGFGVGVFA